jgi:hypothetical protein
VRGVRFVRAFASRARIARPPLVVVVVVVVVVVSSARDASRI